MENQDHFLIRDAFSGYEEMPRYWIFHVPKDKSIALNDGAVFVSGKQKTMVITSADSELPVSLYLGFKQRFPSVTSTAVNKASDSRAIVFGPFTSDAMQFDFQFI